MVVEIHVKVFWVVMSCSIVVGYKHFKGPCCHHLQGEVEWRWRHQSLLEWYPTPILPSATTQKTSTWNEICFDVYT